MIDLKINKLFWNDYYPENEEEMDKDYKRLGREAKKIEKDTTKVLAKDQKRDSLVEKGKKSMKKGKC
jgi:hypothetical protein